MENPNCCFMIIVSTFFSPANRRGELWVKQLWFFHSFICGFMPNLHKTSWMVSNMEASINDYHWPRFIGSIKHRWCLWSLHFQNFNTYVYEYLWDILLLNFTNTCLWSLNSPIRTSTPVRKFSHWWILAWRHHFEGGSTICTAARKLRKWFWLHASCKRLRSVHGCWNVSIFNTSCKFSFTFLGKKCFIIVTVSYYIVQGHHGEFEPGKAQYSTPNFFEQLFLIRGYWHPKSRQGPGLGGLASYLY